MLRRRLSFLELVPLAGAHACVEVALVSHLEERLSNLVGCEAERVRVRLTAARARAAKLTAIVSAARPQSTQKARARVREAARLLDAELTEPGESGSITREDLALAVALARAGQGEAKAKADAARLELDRILGKWRQHAARVGGVCTADTGANGDARGLLVGLSRFARTNAAREALTVAAGSHELRPEVEIPSLATARAIATRAGLLQARVDAFTAVAASRELPAGAHARRFVLEVLDEPRSPAASVRAFNAFRGAAAMLEVAAARAAELTQVGSVWVAVGGDLDWLPKWKGEVLMASLSACGVLCMGGLARFKLLTVAHLPSRRAVRVRCHIDFVHGFVHGRELYVAQVGRDTLWHAPVAEVLAGRTDLRTFNTFPLAAMWGSTPRLDAAPAGWVAVRNNCNYAQHMVVDLAARTSRLVDVGQDFPFLGGFTGIDVPGVSWAVSGFGASTVFAVAPGSAPRRLADGIEGGPTVLPSASRASELARAAVYDGGGTFSVGDAQRRLADPVLPFAQSLVRLYRDVFLCWDDTWYKNSWFVLRIVVP